MNGRARSMVLAALLGCSGGAERPAPAIVPEPASPPSPPVEPAPAAPVHETTPLGRERVPDAPSAEARAAQDRAEAAERAGDLAAARAGWEEAIRLAPDFDAAHFELARVLSLAGALEDSAREVRIALRHDLGRFRARFADDQALATLRASPVGAELAREIGELEAAWRVAFAEGMPVTEWRRLEPLEYFDVMLGDAGEHEARAALWVEAWRRYVLVSPPRRHAVFARVDPTRGRSVVVSAPVGVMDDVGYYLDGARVDVYGVDPSLTSLTSWVAGPTWAVELDLDRATLAVCREDLWEGIQLCAELGSGDAPTIARDALALDAVVTMRGDRPAEEAPPAGYSLAGDRLETPGGPIDLSPVTPARAHARLHLSPNARALVVVACRCHDEDQPWARCAVDAVDLGARTAHRLADDLHHVAVAFDAAGGIYLQGRHGGEGPPASEAPITLVRHATASAPAAALPAGLVLERPIAEPCWPIDYP